MPENKRKTILVVKCKAGETKEKTLSRLLLAANIPYPPLESTDFERN